MKQFGWRFGSFYWRLTVSYFLVTVVAVLVILGAGTLLSHLSVFQQSQSGASTQAVRWVPLDTTSRPEQVAPTQQVAPYLEQTAPDRSALQHWVIPHLFAYLEQNKGAIVPLIAILDRTGDVVASADCTANAAKTGSCPSGPMSSQTSSQASALLTSSQDVVGVIHAALNGDTRPADVSTATSSGSLEAMPIRSYDGQVMGALVVLFAPFDAKAGGGHSIGEGVSAVWSAFLNNIGSAQFYVALLAIAVGTLSGVLLSRSLRRRLLAIAQAADAWSGGEFHVAVRDNARDEIGQLARHLDDMAHRLDTLLTTREALAVVEERNRLARELHDAVKQHVFATALLVRSARKQLARSPQTAANHLAEAEALAGQTQEELTTLIQALRPAGLANRGLVPVLRDLVSEWSRRTGIAAELQVQGQRETALDTEEALFRVVQEALANVARHSHATAVEVRLTWEDNAAILIVQDNGQGFDVSHQTGKGVGLASMHERVEALGGSLTIESAPGSTVISGHMPLERVPLAHAPTAVSQEPLEAAHE